MCIFLNLLTPFRRKDILSLTFTLPVPSLLITVFNLSYLLYRFSLCLFFFRDSSPLNYEKEKEKEKKTVMCSQRQCTCMLQCRNKRHKSQCLRSQQGRLLCQRYYSVRSKTTPSRKNESCIWYQRVHCIYLFLRCNHAQCFFFVRFHWFIPYLYCQDVMGVCNIP